MFWASRQRVERRISRMHSLLASSFSNVKNDTQNIFRWLNFLHQKNLEQENRIKQLELELSYIPKKPEDIRKIIDSYYSFGSMAERINVLNQKIDNIYLKPQPAKTDSPDLYDIKKRLKELEEQKKATIREKIIKRVAKNSKEYVKSLILSYIRKYSQISSLQLKEMIVQDQGLCSKSSFYRLLEELEAAEEIGAAKQGRQKYYIYKPVREH